MTTSKEEKKPSASIYPIVISSIALLISASSFYIAYFSVNHSLELGVVKSGPDDSDIPCNFFADIILLNNGNKAETLLNAELILDGEGTVHFPATQKGPLVLKSGDALPLRIEVKLGEHTFDEAKWNGDKGDRKAEVDIVLEASAVNSKGREVKTRVTLGRVLYHEPFSNFTYDGSASRELALVQLIH